MYIALLSPRTSPELTSLHFPSFQNKITSHKSRHFTPHHYTSHHFTYLHSIPSSIPLLVTTFLALFLNVFSLQGKEASKPAGNWFQLLMVLFTKEYLPTSVLCFLVLIFRICGHLTPQPLYPRWKSAGTPGRALNPVWTFWRREKWLAPAGIRTPYSSYYIDYTVSPDLFRSVSTGNKQRLGNRDSVLGTDIVFPSRSD